MHTSLIDNPLIDILKNVEQLLPEDPTFQSISQQTLIIQKLASGIHEYYPVILQYIYLLSKFGLLVLIF